jgi:hypothetical protein
MLLCSYHKGAIVDKATICGPPQNCGGVEQLGSFIQGTLLNPYGLSVRIVIHLCRAVTMLRSGLWNRVQACIDMAQETGIRGATHASWLPSPHNSSVPS